MKAKPHRTSEEKAAILAEYKKATPKKKVEMAKRLGFASVRSLSTTISKYQRQGVKPRANPQIERKRIPLSQRAEILAEWRGAAALRGQERIARRREILSEYGITYRDVNNWQTQERVKAKKGSRPSRSFAHQRSILKWLLSAFNAIDVPEDSQKALLLRAVQD